MNQFNGQATDVQTAQRKQSPHAKNRKAMSKVLRDKAMRIRKNDSELADYIDSLAVDVATSGFTRPDGTKWYCSNRWLCMYFESVKAWRQAGKTFGAVRRALRFNSSWRVYWLTVSLPATRSLADGLWQFLTQYPNFLSDFTVGSSWRLDIRYERGEWFLHAHAVVLLAGDANPYGLLKQWHRQFPHAEPNRQNIRQLDAYSFSDTPDEDSLAADAFNVIDYTHHGPTNHLDNPLSPELRFEIFMAFNEMIVRHKLEKAPKTQGFTGELHGGSKAQKHVPRSDFLSKLSCSRKPPQNPVSGRLKERIAASALKLKKSEPTPSESLSFNTMSSTKVKSAESKAERTANLMSVSGVKTKPKPTTAKTVNPLPVVRVRVPRVLSFSLKRASENEVEIEAKVEAEIEKRNPILPSPRCQACSQ